MKKLIFLLGFIALAAVIGFSMIACGNGGDSSPSGGSGNPSSSSGDISLYYWGSGGGTWVGITYSGTQTPWPNDFVITIGGADVNINGGYGPVWKNNMSTYYINFWGVTLEVGKSYVVKVVYTGDEMDTFTREATVICTDDPVNIFN